MHYALNDKEVCDAICKRLPLQRNLILKPIETLKIVSPKDNVIRNRLFKKNLGCILQSCFCDDIEPSYLFVCIPKCPVFIYH